MRGWIVFAVMAALAGSADAADFAPQKPRWTENDERGFERFVTAIYDSGCTSTETCLTAPANPLGQGAPPLPLMADCADFAYMLRGYYAWRNGLPFGFVDGLMPAAPGEGGDLRANAGGNFPVSRFDIAPARRVPVRMVLDLIRDTVSTATLRVDPRLDGAPSTDFFSPALTREALRPGALIYDGDGHVAIIGRIDAAGRIYLMDAHPGGSVTRGLYRGQFGPALLPIGTGFKAWRPVDGVSDERLVLRPDRKLPAFSLDQYAAAPARGAHVDGLRRALAGRNTVDPVEDFALGLDFLCLDMKARVHAVSAASGLGSYGPRPVLLDGSDAGLEDFWFETSTPMRDRRLRRQLAFVAEDLARHTEAAIRGEAWVRWRSADPKAALTALYAQKTAACRFAYRNSAGVAVTLNLNEALERLGAFSFDSFACPERRWGASGAELATCRDDATEARWYQAQAPLRAGLDRVAGLPEAATLAELEALAPRPAFDGLAALRRAMERAPGPAAQPARP